MPGLVPGIQGLALNFGNNAPAELLDARDFALA
jgi:hypothetical protein